MRYPRWSNEQAKMFQAQVGWISPPHDFDPSLSDFIRLAPRNVGVIHRLLHVDGYRHRLDERARSFDLLEEAADALAASGAEVIGQVGTNWSHCNGSGVADIDAYCERLTRTYGPRFLMAGLCLVRSLEHLGVSRVAVNNGYYPSDWRDGIVRFFRSGGIDVLWNGNLADQGIYDDERQVADQWWIFPEHHALESCRRTLDRAPGAQAVVVTGVPCWRAPDGSTYRTLACTETIEAALGVPLVSSEAALAWSIFSFLGIGPTRTCGRLMATL